MSFVNKYEADLMSKFKKLEGIEKCSSTEKVCFPLVGYRLNLCNQGLAMSDDCISQVCFTWEVGADSHPPHPQSNPLGK